MDVEWRIRCGVAYLAEGSGLATRTACVWEQPQTHGTQRRLKLRMECWEKPACGTCEHDRPMPPASEWIVAGTATTLACGWTGEDTPPVRMDRICAALALGVDLGTHEFAVFRPLYRRRGLTFSLPHGTGYPSAGCAPAECHPPTPALPPMSAYICTRAMRAV